MSDFYRRINLQAQAAYPAISRPDVALPFEPRSVLIHNISDVDVLVSFSQTKDDARLVPASATAALEWAEGGGTMPDRAKIWLRAPTPSGSGTTYVDVMAGD